MKKADIKRLETVVKKLKEIEDILDKTAESTYKNGDKFTSAGIEPVTVSISSLVNDMNVDARKQRIYIEGKIKCFKEDES